MHKLYMPLILHYDDCMSVIELLLAGKGKYAGLIQRTIEDNYFPFAIPEIFHCTCLKFFMTMITCPELNFYWKERGST